MKYKKFTILFFVLCIIYTAIIAARLWYIDPLHLFHKPYVCKDSLFKNQRFSNSLIIREYDFDGIIIGTSMLENTSANEASDILGGKFMNLAMSGSTFSERKIVLNHAFKHKKINQVVYSLDPLTILAAARQIPDYYDPDLFSFLYDENKFNDVKAYLNAAFMKRIFKYKCNKNSIDRPNAWMTPKDQTMYGFEAWANRQANLKEDITEILDAVDDIKNNHTQKPTDLTKEIDIARKYIDDNVLIFVKQHPETEFHMFIPPYARMYNAIKVQARYNDFIIAKESLRYLVSQTQKYKNLKIYGWGDTDYPDDTNNYKDLKHYHHDFNTLMLYYIAQNNGRLTPDNFDAYYDEFEKKSQAFDLMPFYQRLKIK